MCGCCGVGVLAVASCFSLLWLGFVIFGFGMLVDGCWCLVVGVCFVCVVCCLCCCCFRVLMLGVGVVGISCLVFWLLALGYLVVGFWLVVVYLKIGLREK